MLPVLIFTLFAGYAQADSTIETDSTLSADSLYILGKAYLEDEYTSHPRFDLAQLYLEKAAQQGHSKALYVLGNEYLSGSRLKKDVEQGLLYLRKAAEKGEPIAYYYLARYFYRQGDMAQAILMLEKAIHLGDDISALELSNLYSGSFPFGWRMKDTTVIDKKKGLFFLFKAAEMGNPRAQLYLASMYGKGVEGYVERDIQKSKYYIRLVEQNPRVEEIPGFTDEIDLAKKALGYP